MLSMLKGSQLFGELDDSELACRHVLSKYLQQTNNRSWNRRGFLKKSLYSEERVKNV